MSFFTEAIPHSLKRNPASKIPLEGDPEGDGEQEAAGRGGLPYQADETLLKSTDH